MQHRINEHDWGDLREILGEQASFSTFFLDVDTVVLLVQVTPGAEIIRFEEPVFGFPSKTLLTQLMMIAP